MSRTVRACACFWASARAAPSTCLRSALVETTTATTCRVQTWKIKKKTFASTNRFHFFGFYFANRHKNRSQNFSGNDKLNCLPPAKGNNNNNSPNIQRERIAKRVREVFVPKDINNKNNKSINRNKNNYNKQR